VATTVAGVDEDNHVVATTAAGVDEDDHGTWRSGGIVAVGAVDVAGFTSDGVLKANGIALA